MKCPNCGSRLNIQFLANEHKGKYCVNACGWIDPTSKKASWIRQVRKQDLEMLLTERSILNKAIHEVAADIMLNDKELEKLYK
jgi:hypothetical protein